MWADAEPKASHIINPRPLVKALDSASTTSENVSEIQLDSVRISLDVLRPIVRASLARHSAFQRLHLRKPSTGPLAALRAASTGVA